MNKNQNLKVTQVKSAINAFFCDKKTTNSQEVTIFDISPTTGRINCRNVQTLHVPEAFTTPNGLANLLKQYGKTKFCVVQKTKDLKQININNGYKTQIPYAQITRTTDVLQIEVVNISNTYNNVQIGRKILTGTLR